MEILDLVFTITVAAELLLGAGLILTVIHPPLRVWPPPGRSTWQFWCVWTLTVVSALGIVAVGILDWNTARLDHWLRFPLGVTLATGGLAFAEWGILTLGRHATLGLGGGLVEDGPYRYTRNPQYVGDIVLLLGWAILCNSGRGWLVSWLGMAWFALAPFTEEPWLEARLGKAYEAYRRRIPRFLGRRRPVES